MVGLADHHHESLLEPLGLPDNQVPPEASLLDAVVRGELLEVGLDEVLEEGHDQLGALTDDFDVLRTLYRNRLVLVAPLVEPDHDLPVNAVPDRELALATVPLPLEGALHELVQLQLRDLLPFCQQLVDFVVLEKLAVVVFNHSVEVFSLPLHLLLVGEGVEGLNDVLDLGVPHFFPVLLGGHHFLLLCVPGALLNGHEVCLWDVHVFLEGLGLDPFVFGELTVEVVKVERFSKLDDEERLVLLLEEVGGLGVFSEVLAEELVAGLGVEKPLNAPDADLIGAAFLLGLLLELL